MHKMTKDEWEAYQQSFDSVSLLRRLRDSGTPLEMQQVFSDEYRKTPERLRSAFAYLFDTVIMPALRSDLAALAVEIEDLETAFTAERIRNLIDKRG